MVKQSLCNLSTVSLKIYGQSIKINEGNVLVIRQKLFLVFKREIVMEFTIINHSIYMYLRNKVPKEITNHSYVLLVLVDVPDLFAT